MKLCAGLVLATVLSCTVVANAKDKARTQTTTANEIMVGSGLICDTKQQAERFVSLMGDDASADIQNTLTTVNNEAGQSDACVVATVGFFPGQKVAELEKNGSVVNVIEVLVLAVGTPSGLKIVEPKMYYSVQQTKDRII
ncbi:hypothetical protein [Pseudorhodoplanes sinuspersici]|uniref:Uncharacterized protein n=1 Tax=Pseudorhodoplanes sinuspersici TaxID=1235591 RepID=A0A1W6ZVY0_9HYPH|nr:hypothetical protein [Pseudorhodoplanes sinuspersici]ARQ01291.1 hypothetical protein CAK95_20970 [Pseudorhodoplanes sinuspersici]RKE72971.1 hypothetical protein DFP91_0845 [Pseudorhodoplanes sinuspersici]